VTAARDVVLRDGTTMRLRPPGREDEERLIAFLERLCDESRYLRFHGFRAEASDASALIDVVHRLSLLAEDLPEVAELDLNPVLGLRDGCVIVDARVRVMTPRGPSRSKTW
jgi:ATP-grasp domain